MPVQASQSTMKASSAKRSYRAVMIPVAIIMLVFWAVVTFAFNGPGWVHLFLSLGVFLLIWGITERGSGTQRRS